ncbi:MAG: 3-phosphoshikimate 1-carboxyvinyltransferase [Candidatus Omnitrophota bacterium]
MIKIESAAYLKGTLRLGGDKSISHRAIILSSLTNQRVRIKNYYPSRDCLTTIRAMRSLGAKIVWRASNQLDIFGVGLKGCVFPRQLFLGDSGTTYRLLTGLLAGQNNHIILRAGKSLSRRPMKRIVGPLTNMGARIHAVSRAKNDEVYPPLEVLPGKLKAITYKLPVASAQVKSAILLAALNTKGETRIIEEEKSRDHTERMLSLFKVKISLKQNSISLKGPVRQLIAPKQIVIPADFSSAAFFIVGALLLKGSKLAIKKTSINPTRTGLLKVLKRMGANIQIRHIGKTQWPNEPKADIIVRYSELKATEVSKSEIPCLIDEVPILMVAASLAKGTTSIKGVGELRVKETDRINSMRYNLRNMGVPVRIKKSGTREDILVEGVNKLKPGKLRSFSDHRTAMATVIAAVCAQGDSLIDDVECISKSFPNFLKTLSSLIHKF